MSLHINCLGFNSLIFRSTGKFVTPFLSIGSEVTTFLFFQNSHFCRPKPRACCLVQSFIGPTGARSSERRIQYRTLVLIKKVSTSERPAVTFCCRSRVKDSPCAPFSVGSPPAQLSASLRVLRFTLALRVCWSGTQPTGVVAKGEKNPDCRVLTRPSDNEKRQDLVATKKSWHFFTHSVAGPKTPFDCQVLKLLEVR